MLINHRVQCDEREIWNGMKLFTRSSAISSSHQAVLDFSRNIRYILIDSDLVEGCGGRLISSLPVGVLSSSSALRSSTRLRVAIGVVLAGAGLVSTSMVGLGGGSGSSRNVGLFLRFKTAGLGLAATGRMGGGGACYLQVLQTINTN
jgi:hypothetical protein